jgi:hypothetical protein
MSTSPCGFQPTTGIGYNIAYKTSDQNPNTGTLVLLPAFQDDDPTSLCHMDLHLLGPMVIKALQPLVVYHPICSVLLQDHSCMSLITLAKPMSLPQSGVQTGAWNTV